jgi:K+-transporting ATPase ATPase A chain
MTAQNLIYVLIYLFSILILVMPLGWYMAQVYEGKSCGLDKILRPLEHLIYRICGVNPDQEMGWKTYLIAMLLLNLVVLLAIYIMVRLQLLLPLNPQHFAAISPALAFNIAAGFTASADWQAYSGESALSYFNQMTTLTVVKFIAAGTGMSLLIAFIRGIVRRETVGLGNFWVDLTRSILYILLPLSFLFAIFLTSQGVIQNLNPYQKIDLLQPLSYQQVVTDNTGQPVKDSHGQAQTKTITLTQQTIPMGPVASSLAIEQFAVNGGGFFNVNNAHPFENPNPLTNFFEMLAMIIIPAAFCYTFGVMVKDKRQGWAILAAMLLIYIPCLCFDVSLEQAGNPLLTHNTNLLSGGNMEGKETRFGIVGSSIYAAAATATASGSNNMMIDSFTPLGILISLWLMHTGEVVFGGVGSGLYGMLMLVILTVFIAGLMVGRSPEYLGKKIDGFEMKMVVFSVLIMPVLVLFFTALAVVLPAGVSVIGNPGAHGFTEILYTFTSMVSTNGGEMAGLNSNTTFYNILGGFTMLFGRYWVAIPVLAIAGSLALKRVKPPNLGTLPTHSFFFVFLLVGVITILGALTFFPALALGPIAEYLFLAK